MPQCRAIVVLAIGTVLSACGIFEPHVDGEYASARVLGRALTTTGAPAAGVAVRVEGRLVGSCSATRDRATAITDSTGWYEAYIGTWGNPYDACVVVIAEPGAGSPLSADSTTKSRVRVGGAGSDSVRLDFALPPRS